MKSMTNFVAVSIIAAIIAGCAGTPEPSRTEVMSIHKELATLDSNLQKARVDGVDFFAPDGYEEAKEALDKGVEYAIDGKAYTEIVAKGSVALKKAEADTQENRAIMREVLVIRERAKKAGAPAILPNEFTQAEDELQSNLRLVEDGKVEKAKKERGALIASYEELELAALKRDTVSAAKDMIAKAEAADAQKYAPKTFALSKDELALAVSVLEAERTQTEKAAEHATRSTALAKRSLYITDTVKNFEQRDFSNEEIVLWYQEQLDAVHAPLPGALNYAQDNHNVLTGFEHEIKSLMDREVLLQNELQQSKESYKSLEAKIALLQQAGTETEENFKKRLAATLKATQEEQARLAQANKEAQERYKQEQADYTKANKDSQARYEKVQSMFTRDEAIVYRQGDNVLLTTYGFDFAIGQSEIKSDNFDLLNKIIEAINTFDKPHVVVTGHTDGTGGEKTNQILSQKRAETVADFLKKVGKIPAQRVRFEGYGESKPLASNETSEGRAKNRRIEILILNNQ